MPARDIVEEQGGVIKARQYIDNLLFVSMGVMIAGMVLAMVFRLRTIGTVCMYTGIGLFFVLLILQGLVMNLAKWIWGYEHSGKLVWTGDADQEEDMFEEFEFHIQNETKIKDIPSVTLRELIAYLIEENARELNEREVAEVCKELSIESKFSEDERQKMLEDQLEQGDLLNE
jgi:hypothetical protein